jgi:hypothetical protein
MTVKLTAVEKRELKQRAASHGLALSQYVRWLLFGVRAAR